MKSNSKNNKMKLLQLFKRRAKAVFQKFAAEDEMAQLRNDNKRLDELWASTTAALLHEEKQNNELRDELNQERHPRRFSCWKSKVEHLKCELQRVCNDNVCLEALLSKVTAQRIEGHERQLSDLIDLVQQLRVEWDECHAANVALINEKEKLRADLSLARLKIAALESKQEEYSRAVTLRSYDEGTARACLMQLRVMQMNVRGRTGYGVTAFISNEVLLKLGTAGQDRLVQFRDAVFSSLLERALVGMWHINSRGNISAVLFAPLGARKEGICGAVFDADRNPHVEFASSHANDTLVRRIETSIIAAQPENRPTPSKSTDAADAIMLAVAAFEAP